MAQDITLLGASYEDVPAVELPKTGGGTASFTDVTDTTAEAADVAQGKYFYTAAGVKTEGTASGGGGGDTAEEKDVNFYDYDGTVVESYTAQEFQALDSLPSNPVHTGLTAQGWNWTLANIKSYLTSYPDAVVNVGQMYTTVSGATEIDVTLDELTLNPYLAVSPNGTASIDWGDNTTDTVTGTSITYIKWTQHTYSVPGDYTIKISATSGTYAMYSNITGGESTVMQYTNAHKNSRLYASKIKAIRIGANVPRIGTFVNLTSLETITIPNTVTTVDRFIRCYQLHGVTIPSGVTTINPASDLQCATYFSIPYGATSISGSFLPNNYKISCITIPDTVTTIGNYAFQYAHGLEKAIIPASVTSMDVGIFFNCRSIRFISVKANITSIGGDFGRECYALENIEFPSTVTSINGFYNCQSLKKVTIPKNVTSLGNACFQNCFSLTEMHVLPETPPTLGNNVTLNGFPDNIVIYVPQESLSAYQSETNWSTWASKMQGE